MTIYLDSDSQLINIYLFEEQKIKRIPLKRQCEIAKFNTYFGAIRKNVHPHLKQVTGVRFDNDVVFAMHFIYCQDCSVAFMSFPQHSQYKMQLFFHKAFSTYNEKIDLLN